MHPATLMDTDRVVSRSIVPTRSVVDGRDRVLLMIDGGALESGESYVDGRPARARDPQAYAEPRARLQRVTEDLVGL